MAKNAQSGSAIAFATLPATYEGSVTEVNDLGVKIITRAYGKQSDVERFFLHKDIVAHTDQGEGFVTVVESRPIASYSGDITISGNEVAVTIEGGRTISFTQTEHTMLQVHYDTEDGKTTSVEANIAKRNAAKLLTAIGRREERSGNAGGKKKSGKKKSK